MYNAAGLVSFDLFDDIDFDKWFTTQLVPEINQRDQRYCIVFDAQCLFGNFVF